MKTQNRTIFTALLYILFLAGIVTVSFNRIAKAYEIPQYTMYPGQIISLELPDIEIEKSITSYTSSNPKIATIINGQIKAKAKGSTTFTITLSDNSQYNIVVRVKKGIRKVNIPQNSLSLNRGDKRTIFVNISNKTSTEPIIWKSSNNKIVTVDEKGQITGKRNGTAYVICKSKYSKKSDKIKVTVKNTKYIAFTFDDGPSIYTNKLLKILRQHNAKATFFVIGNRLNNYSDILKKEVYYGHQIGNHTYSHAFLPQLSKKEIKEQINKTNNLIKNIVGQKSTAFRPPYGSYDRYSKSASNTPIILWSVDTLDWKYKNADYVKNAILSSKSDGEIILLHDIHKTTIAGFEAAIKQLKDSGYELVTVNEMFEIKNITLKKNEIYYYAK